MRVMGFTKKWDKLKDLEFNTFRMKRKDKDWTIGERVQIVYHPRSKDREILGEAEIINIEPRSFYPYTSCQITNAEARADGFKDVEDMKTWLIQAHGNFPIGTIFNKITLRRG